MQKSIKLIIKIVIIISLIVYLFDNIDVSQLLESFKKFNFYGFLLSVFFCFVSCYFLAKRWVLILKNSISSKDGLESTFICLGLNNLLPGKAGEFLKVLYLKKISRIRISFALPLMLVERLLDVLLLFTFILVGSFFNTNLNFYFLLVIIAFTLMFLFFVIYYRKLILRRSLLIKHLRIRSFVVNFVKTIARVKIKEFFLLSLYTILIWFLYFLYLYVFIFFGTDFNINIYQAMIVFIFISIGMAIPLSPGGVGTVHIGAVLSLGWFGVDKSDALAFAIVFHLVQFLPTTIIGVILLYKRFSINIFSIKKRLKEVINVTDDKTVY